jgi:hypothetical protein
MRSHRAGRDARPRVALSTALVLLALASCAAPAIAVELEENQTYAGVTRVESSSIGVAFLIPEGWGGRFELNSLLLRSNTIEGVVLAILQADVTADQVMSSLDKAQDLGAGVVLRLTGPPVAQGSLIASRYEDERYVGRGLALLGPTRNAVIYFVAGPAKNESAYVRLLAALGRSTSFVESAPASAQTPGSGPAPNDVQTATAQTPAPPPASNDGPSAPAAAQAPPPVPSDVDPMWATLLTGQALNYFSSYNSGGGGGGMASRRILHLCANGRFAYSGEGLTTMNVPGATGSSGGRNGFQGRWSLESPTQTTATLVLTVDDGQELRWRLRYVDKKTFVNGQRWFREPSSACR